MEATFMSVDIYHNPRCSKSRQTLELLHEAGIQPNIIDYQKNPPDYATLSNLLVMLGKQPEEILRTGESLYKELDIKNKNLSRGELIDLMVQHPILIERPIVENQSKAALGRPPEQVKEIL